MQAFDTNYSWLPLPGPPLERVMLCGWTESCRGYWWYEEGVLDEEGRPIDQPRASHFAPIIMPVFPEVPA